METVGAYDANRLPELLKRGAKEERITITRHGVPVAVSMHWPPPENAIAALRRFRSRHALAGITVRELIEEGRR